MTIKVEKNSTHILLKDKTEKVLVLGYEEIRLHGFQVVDHIVEDVITKLEKLEEVFVSGDTLEAKMIARKIEDKIKREVILLSN